MEQCREREAITNILNISRLGNQFMQAEKPWLIFKYNSYNRYLTNCNFIIRKLVKSTSIEDKNRAATVVSFCVNLACLLAILSEPFMPDLSESLLKQLNISRDAVNTLSVGYGNTFRLMLPTGKTNYLF